MNAPAHILTYIPRTMRPLDVVLGLVERGFTVPADILDRASAMVGAERAGDPEASEFWAREIEAIHAAMPKAWSMPNPEPRRTDWAEPWMISRTLWAVRLMGAPHCSRHVLAPKGCDAATAAAYANANRSLTARATYAQVFDMEKVQ